MGVPRPHSVVFDVGHVLIDWDLRYLYEKLIPDDDALEAFLGSVITRDWHFQHDAGRWTHETIPERIAAFPQHRQLIEAYEPRWLETLGRPLPGMAQLVESLHARGVPLYAITNFSAQFWPRFVEHFPLVRRFRDVIVSGAEKLVKPDPAIFRLALQRFGLGAGEALFIDDREDNVAAAQANGFTGHHFRGAVPLAQALAGYGLIASRP